MLLYPWLADLVFHGNARAAGVFLGTSIHDTSQVIGAALIYAQQFGVPDAVPVAGFTKLLRNLSMLALIPLAAWSAERADDRDSRPAGARDNLRTRWRKVMPPLAGLGDWEATMALSNALGYPMRYEHPSQIMDEIARLTPTFRGVTYEKIDRLGSVQWPCNEGTDEAGTAIMHVGHFVRGKGRFVITQYVASEEKVTRKFPLLLTTGRILSQYNVGAQTRRTPNNLWHDEDRLEIHPHDAEDRGIREGDWVGISSRAGDTVLRATLTERVAPGVVYTTFHFPESGANVITTDSSDWATNCPEYKVTAVQVTPVQQPSQWQREYGRFNREQLDLLEQARQTGSVPAK